MTENTERMAEVKLSLSCDCHGDTGEVRVQVYVHTYINTCIHTYIHTHTYTHSCIYTYIHTEIDHEVQPKDWLRPADSVRITEQHDQHAIPIFTDGSKSEHGVGAGVAVFIQSKLAHQSRYTLHNRCSNNQAEQPAIDKALEIIGKLYIMIKFRDQQQ